MRIEFFDGGLGSMLQTAGLKPGTGPDTWNLTHPEEVLNVHKAYAAAGAEYITTNTFGANRLRYDNAESLVKAGVELAKSAGKKVALDLGPTGKLLKPMGELDFEEAVSVYKEIVGAGKAEADAVIIETVSDVYEMKAALLAVKESCSLPVFASFMFDENARLLTGADVQTAVCLAESMGADVIGINCGFGPEQFKKLVKELRKYTSLPVLAQPNAGIPESVNGKTIYSVSPEQYAKDMKEIADIGVCYLGGCCGTTPEHIEEMVKACGNTEKSVPEKKSVLTVSSYSKTVVIGEKPVIIGERLNPTGKKALKQALLDGDNNYVVKEATAQAEAGAHILDVNAGIPKADEKSLLTNMVKSVQAVSDIPLQIDTADISALESALRIYNGKPMINSVNGKEESMNAVFPLAKKYGALTVCLLLDENGIPDTAEGRIKIAKKIIDNAKKYGIGTDNLIFDALTLTVSTDKNNAKTTLKTLELLKEAGLHSILGVSNISFGLPNRTAVNTAFYTMAMQSGLNAGIINPLSEDMTNAYFAYNALAGFDEGCKEYINSVTETGKLISAHESKDLKSAIISGLSEEAVLSARSLIKERNSLEIIELYIIPALDEAGNKFENKKMFLPQLLMSADAAKAAFDEIKKHLSSEDGGNRKGEKIILATVEGDVHDIGKNIVKVLLENYGYDVIDLGKDVPCEEVLRQVKERGVKLVGLSALMTTTVPSMEKTIKLIHAETDAKVMVGGAVLTPKYARLINADFYAKDAMEGVNIAKEFFGK